jgi:hypothetical protein
MAQSLTDRSLLCATSVLSVSLWLLNVKNHRDTENTEAALVRAGGTPQGSYKAVTVWARACETRSPACQLGVEAMRPYVVASGKLDGNGAFTFPNARAGVFYGCGVDATRCI